MDYKFKLYKLKFTAPVHFGADKPGFGLDRVNFTCRADTFFSALCWEAVKIYGEEFLNRMVDSAKRGDMLISDLLPFQSDTLFIPKPCYNAKRDEKQLSEREDSNTGDRKKLKKMTHIAVTELAKYMKFVRNGHGKDMPDFNSTEGLFAESASTKVSADRRGEDGQPFYFGSVTFAEDAGLYLLLRYAHDDMEQKVKQLIISLGIGGIGGKTSAGYGKFKDFEDPIEMDLKEPATDEDRLLLEYLTSTDSDYYMSLSTFLPDGGELREDLTNKSFYNLVYRGGFVNSSIYSDEPKKRNSITMFSAGSCFPERLSGQVADLNAGGNHPVYRYGKALMMGVKI